MASNNIQKIVQNNFHLNPWVLSKNTNEIVNTYIQKIYKQMPFTFRKDHKPPKIAAERPENKAPIRTFKSQQMTEQQDTKIIPQTTNVPVKKSARSKPPKLNHERLMQILGASNQNNQQIRKKSTATINTILNQKKPIKSPNLKIYGSRRYGSSASSSRSSLFRRHEDKRRKHQSSFQTQLNIMARSYHSGGHLHDSIAKCLIPLRNQYVKGNLGSLPEAMRVSSSIQNDLMIIDDVLRNRISVNGGRKLNDISPIKITLEPTDRLKAWKHPPPLEKFPIHNINELLAKSSNKQMKVPAEKPSLSRSRLNLFKYSSPNDSEFRNLELKEWHRRNRMKKLGLIKDPIKPTGNNNPTNVEGAKLRSTQNKNLCDANVSELNNCCHVGRHFTYHDTSTKMMVQPQERKIASSKYGKSAGAVKSRPSPTDVIVSPSSSESSTFPVRLNVPLTAVNLNAMLANKRFDRNNCLSMAKY